MTTETKTPAERRKALHLDLLHMMREPQDPLISEIAFTEEGWNTFKICQTMIFLDIIQESEKLLKEE